MIYFIACLIGTGITAHCDYWLENHYPNHWFVKNFCWLGKLEHDGHCWENGYDRIKNK